MIPTGLPPAVHADLSRVIESLGMLTPRWNARILITLAGRPLRYTEIKSRMPWLQDGQLHPKLRWLSDAGLVERTEHGVRHVTYGLSARGRDLMPVLAVISVWGDAHLEKATPTAAGAQTASTVQDIEDSLVLISYRHATPILWSLQARGAAGATAIAADAMPGQRLSAVYPRLRQLVDDRLVDTDAERTDYRLSSPGRALAPVYRALSAWAAGRPLADAATHPVWGHPPAPSQSATGMWASTAKTPPAPQTTPAAQWRAGDLFSHQAPARAGAPAGGHRR
ncbi:winged helix-turn-helix transcriptional regulator [Streptomyces jumonjinensis]|uniref:winged helix-turn-helix transcriptional regulator n=1 Tax=Streptomyces jumonjinensis TaxID=1945 RepID=UPI003790827F